MTTRDTEVIIAGAGPTGLMLANWLQRLGVPHLLLDPKTGPTRESRALALQARSLEIYDQLGMIDAVRDAAAPAFRVYPGWRDRPAPSAVPLARLGAGLTPYPGLAELEQSENERLLVEHLERAGGTVGWGHEITEHRETPDGVRVRFTTPDGPGEATGHWLVGADGASSPTRERAGIAFTGTTQPGSFWVADARDVTGLPADAVSLRFAEHGFLITFPMRGRDHHRLIGMDRADEPSEATVRRDVAERFGVTWGESAWFAHYRVHHRIADRFRTGRVLLAGDAAHVHSPVGGQGMNTGLQDAHNLAYKLAAVAAGAAGEKALDRYQAERRPVARRLVGGVDRVFDAVVDPSPAMVAARRILVPLWAPLLGGVLPRLPIARRLVGYLGQFRIHYWMTDAARATGRRNPVVGRRLPWTGQNFDVLRDASWQVHAYGATAPTLAGLPEVIRAAHRFGERRDLHLDPALLHLVRPDGFVAATAAPADAPAEFARVLAEQGYRG